METLYIKVGKKYKKIGCTANTNLMRDGLWLIQSHENSKEYNNMSLRMNDLPQPVDVQKFTKAFLSKEAIIQAVQNLEKSKNFQFYNVSLNDFADEIVKEVYKNSQKD